LELKTPPQPAAADSMQKHDTNRFIASLPNHRVGLSPRLLDLAHLCLNHGSGAAQGAVRFGTKEQRWSKVGPFPSLPRTEVQARLFIVAQRGFGQIGPRGKRSKVGLFPSLPQTDTRALFYDSYQILLHIQRRFFSKPAHLNDGHKTPLTGGAYLASPTCSDLRVFIRYI
jgi:hypothetical protein